MIQPRNNSFTVTLAYAIFSEVVRMNPVSQGRLEDNPPAELICEIGAKASSGALRLSRARAKAVVYFENGAVIFAASNLRPHRLLEFLKRAQMLPEHKLHDIPASTGDDELLKLLATREKVSPGAIASIRANHVADILRSVLLWTDGEWSFDARVRIAGDTRVPVDVKRLLLESARRLPAAFIKPRLADLSETLSTVATNGTATNLLPSEAFVLSRVTDPTTLKDLLALCGLSEAEGLRAIYGLSIAGYLRRGASPSINLTSARATAEAMTSPAENNSGDVEQLFARLAAAADHYEVLGLGRQADADEIKAAYHALARRYHPDRFHQADVQLRSRVDSAFARISRAYETLNDSTSRKSYDAQFANASPLSKEKDRDDAPSTPKRTVKAADKARAEETFKRAVTAANQNQYERAVRLFAEAASIEPRRARYRAEYGRALSKEPKTRRLAEIELKAAIELEPENVNYRVMLAELYLALGLRRRAQAEVQRALSLDPKNAEARSLLAKSK